MLGRFGSPDYLHDTPTGGGPPETVTHTHMRLSCSFFVIFVAATKQRGLCTDTLPIMMQPRAEPRARENAPVCLLKARLACARSEDLHSSTAALDKPRASCQQPHRHSWPRLPVRCCRCGDPRPVAFIAGQIVCFSANISKRCSKARAVRLCSTSVCACASPECTARSHGPVHSKGPASSRLRAEEWLLPSFDANDCASERHTPAGCSARGEASNGLGACARCRCRACDAREVHARMLGMCSAHPEIPCLRMLPQV